MAKRSKKYRAALERIETDRLYGPKAGFTLLKEIDAAGYDATGECAFRPGADRAASLLRTAFMIR